MNEGQKGEARGGLAKWDHVGAIWVPPGAEQEGERSIGAKRGDSTRHPRDDTTRVSRLAPVTMAPLAAEPRPGVAPPPGTGNLPVGNAVEPRPGTEWPGLSSTSQSLNHVWNWIHTNGRHRPEVYATRSAWRWRDLAGGVSELQRRGPTRSLFVTCNPQHQRTISSSPVVFRSNSMTVSP